MIQPVETTYGGYRFRSRTEARWAVFLDTLRVQWEYEKEGYDLGDLGWYLPDFWLPGWKCFAEVKGQAFSEDEVRKCCRLNRLTGRSVILLSGMPGDCPGHVVVGPDPSDVWYVNWDASLGKGRLFYDFSWGEVLARIEDSPEEDRAANVARSARFEHGESGIVILR